MMVPSPPRPIEKNLLLVGAGNAHLVFVKRWGMRPMPGVAVTLVNQGSRIPYSAMVPGHIAGDYSWDEVSIDLVRLCASAGVRLLRERVTAIDPSTRQVQFAGRASLSYDALSLGLGSIPACPANLLAAESSLVLRPMAEFLRKLEALAQRLRQSADPFHLAVVGGGASGCELALALHKRLGDRPDFRVTLLHGNDRLVPNFPEGVARAFEQTFAARGIGVRVNARVTGSDGPALLLESGERVSFDAVLWATNASPPPVLRDAGLPLDEGGFLQVRETLQSVSDPSVFGTGDCVHFVAYPDLPKNGVHAVRQGKVLFENIAAFFRDRPLTPFRPQRFTLALLNTADGEAILSYGPFTAKGRWARKLKDRIDRAWIEKYIPEPGSPVSEEAEPLMRCGGCGSKISGDVLSAVLKRIAVASDPRVLLGCADGEDAAVHRVLPAPGGIPPEKLLEVQTVDYFKAFVDDPYLFGRVAALHGVSDLYAMNARPFAALAIATLPYARGPVQEAQLYELLSGAVRSLQEMGVVLTGGHTTEGHELALGFAVTGHAEEGRLFEKSRLQPGDQLVLTKPLGSGALLAAWMRGACRAAWFDRLCEGLLLSNGPAAEVFARAGVAACTDITGFGLAGHLLEMLNASGVSARLSDRQVPLYDGFLEVVSQGMVSSLHRDNAKQGCRVEAAGPHPDWLFDPQTSGGLLAAVKPGAVAAVLEELRLHYPDAAVIGEVVPTEAGGLPTIYLV